MPMLIAIIAGFMILLAGGLAFIMKRSRGLGAFHARRLKALWARLETNPTPALKVIEADKILDEALKMLGYDGSLGEKLKKAGPRFSDIDGLWSAHKLRNRLAHELNAKPSDAEVRTALTAFKRGLKDLGIQ